jgi:hypothetical protein
MKHLFAKTKPSEKPPTTTAEESLASIPRVKDDPTLKAAGDKLRLFEEQLTAVRLELSRTRGDNSNACGGLPPARFNREADGRAIFAGEIALEGLAGANTTTITHDLVRQRQALEVAIDLQKDVVRGAEMDAVYRLCEEHRGEIMPFFERTIDAFAALEVALRELSVMHDGLQRRGYRPEYRPTGWCLSGYESNILHGDQGRCSLDWFIRTRRETLGLPDKGGE